MAATSWFSFSTSAEYLRRTRRSPASASAVVIADTSKNEIVGGRLRRNCISAVPSSKKSYRFGKIKETSCVRFSSAVEYCLMNGTDRAVALEHDQLQFRWRFSASRVPRPEGCSRCLELM